MSGQVLLTLPGGGSQQGLTIPLLRESLPLLRGLITCGKACFPRRAVSQQQGFSLSALQSPAVGQGQGDPRVGEPGGHSPGTAPSSSPAAAGRPASGTEALGL